MGAAQTAIPPFLGPEESAASLLGQPRRHDSATKPPFVTNLPRLNSGFVGREAVLAELRRLLTEGKGPTVSTQVITGLGGIGKTWTALAYCHRYLADYRLIWWLRSENPIQLRTDYANLYPMLAKPLGLAPEVANPDKRIANIRNKLPDSVYVPYLLVFDNIEDPDCLSDYLPRSGGHALITSRRTDWGDSDKALPLELMLEAEALQLLTGRHDPETLPAPELAEAKKLARELGYLPLALSQAYAFTQARGGGLAGYRRLLVTHGSQVMAWRLRPKSRTLKVRGGIISRAARYLSSFCFSQRIFPPQIIQVLLKKIPSREYTQENPTADYPYALAKTWEASFYHAKQDCPAARELLHILAFIPVDPIPYKLFDAAPEALPECLRDTFNRQTAIEALARFSLLRADVDTLTVHRLVQLITRNMLDNATTKTTFSGIASCLLAAYLRPVHSMDGMDIISDLDSATLFTPEEEALLAEIKDPVQRATFTLQKIMERENLLESILTNMSHMLYGTAKSIAQNLR